MDWFWSEWFWVQPGKTWDDYKPIPGINIHESDDIWRYPILFMLGLIFIRNYILLPLIFTPIGKYFDIRSKPYRAPDSIPQLEKLYKINRARPPRQLLQRCATEINWTERRVERWLRQKALSQQMTTLDKFNDYGWQFTYYTSYFIFGLFFVVCNQSWFYNMEEVLENFPRPMISRELWWYYMIGIGFYLTQTYLLFVQTRRHDFHLMLIHHGCTIFLIIFSWVANVPRGGAISFFIHECADIPLALGKLIHYCGYTRTAELMFIPFCLVWISTRLVMYPLHFLKGMIFVGYTVLPELWPVFYLLLAMCVALLVLHIIWTKEIFVAVKRKLFSGEIVDHRSSPEEMSEDENDAKTLHSEAYDKLGELRQLKSDTVIRRPAQS